MADRRPRSRSPVNVAAPEQTMVQLLERMAARDEARDQRNDAQNDALVQVTSRMGSLASTLEGQQIQLDRLIRLQENQAEHNLKMVSLFERSAEHSRTFERFGNDIEALKTKAHTMETARASDHGSLRMLVWVIATTLPIGIILVGFVYNTLSNRIDDLKASHKEDINEIRQEVKKP